ncbi:dGTPase [Ekhidna lutea]|uniref:dGTPase n=1 Tax=Ekhidna lutea TaxID=447679 RepID=A0A239GWE1_EKHLU|nr:dNTP triphosphohydrolase [Ekhidna lutea]SNS73529.1 dGTPase [Ekhidna lutea]
MNWKQFLNAERDRPSEREQDRKVDPRNEFESDFGRVIFSPATRRMHDKTQVFPLTTDDNIHSRLTHSMEVMAIGHSLGLRVVENDDFLEKTKLPKDEIHRDIPVILKNACLVHDIGNPPFGHFGETVISSYFKRFFNYDKESNSFGKVDPNIAKLRLSDDEKKDFTLFDGNAQGLRVLTKLQVLNDDKGLNLTYATLGAFIKYPNYGDPIKGNLPYKKRGVFQSEINIFKQVVDECGLEKDNEVMRHPLAFLMEAADSICYLVMDLEDSFNKGWYSYKFIAGKLKGVSQSIDDKLEKLERKEVGLGSEITKMVKLRIHLISELVKVAVKNFVDNLELICAGQYKNELIHDDPNKLADTLADFSYDHIFPKREIQQLELTGHSVITGLLDYYIDFIFFNSGDYRKRAEGILSNSLKRAAMIENKVDKFEDISDYYKLRTIVDYISGMTDQFALNQYQKLSGQKI